MVLRAASNQRGAGPNLSEFPALTLPTRSQAQNGHGTLKGPRVPLIFDKVISDLYMCTFSYHVQHMCVFAMATPD